MAPVVSDPLLTPSEVADILHVTPTTVSNWARSGRLPCIKLPGGQRRFRRSDVDAVLNPAPSTDAAGAA